MGTQKAKEWAKDLAQILFHPNPKIKGTRSMFLKSPLFLPKIYRFWLGCGFSTLSASSNIHPCLLEPTYTSSVAQDFWKRGIEDLPMGDIKGVTLHNGIAPNQAHNYVWHLSYMGMDKELNVMSEDLDHDLIMSRLLFQVSASL